MLRSLLPNRPRRNNHFAFELQLACTTIVYNGKVNFMPSSLGNHVQLPFGQKAGCQVIVDCWPMLLTLDVCRHACRATELSTVTVCMPSLGREHILPQLLLYQQFIICSQLYVTGDTHFVPRLFEHYTDQTLFFTINVSTDMSILLTANSINKSTFNLWINFTS